MLMMAKTTRPTKHFLMSDVVVLLDTEVLELKVNEGVGGDSQQGDQAGDEGIAGNADGVRTAFSREAAINSKINAEENDDGDDVKSECDLSDAECRASGMGYNASDDLDGAFECRCPEENPCGIDDNEGYCAP